MKFSDLDTKMRIYETVDDKCFLPEMYLVVRLDGRSFTRFTKETMQFEAPFDVRFSNMMMNTCIYLMKDVGIKIQYAYTESDEISLLLAQDNTFSRKARKLISVLAGSASGYFSVSCNLPVCFDARVSQLPNQDLVVDYFKWRQEDANRNALNSHCYWLLRKQGLSAKKADKVLLGQTVAFKNELLFQNGINYNDDIPLWQKRGIGIHWYLFDKQGFNPVKNEQTVTQRRGVSVNTQLPIGVEYGNYIRKIVEGITEENA